MNEKFFDLKKEKQDRMINAALKIFAANGYKHASTDDIVATAEISKGLLFHYFGSKQGLYSFLFDYSVKYMKLELSRGVSEGTTDYFEIRKQVELSKMQVLKNYPNMQQFLDRSKSESASDALSVIADQSGILSEVYAEIYSRVDKGLFIENIELEKLHTMLEYTIRGLMDEHFQAALFNPEKLYDDIAGYLMMVKKLAYK
ncbi:MAG: TetR/AcrR family transcriptional regulator [Clostridiales bacterium]|nr:TetR/AcrR family transcriptional regulator [Clostridiales bacterium]